MLFSFCGAFNLGILQVNVVSYKARPTAKDFIQVEIVVEQNSQKIILIGKVSIIDCGIYWLVYFIFYFIFFLLWSVTCTQ
jgi:hypothetical protein